MSGRVRRKEPDPQPERHLIAMKAIVVIRCICGWFHRIEQIRGKTDRELEDEGEAVFLEHARKMEAEGF